jgi:transposase
MVTLSVHKGETVRAPLQEADARVLYLPPYSADFNPIEEAFSKIKYLIRKGGGASTKLA